MTGAARRRRRTLSATGLRLSLGAPEFPYGVAKKSGRKGSNVYEVNQWLWRLGTPKAQSPKTGD